MSTTRTVSDAPLSVDQLAEQIKKLKAQNLKLKKMIKRLNREIRNHIGRITQMEINESAFHERWKELERREREVADNEAMKVYLLDKQMRQEQEDASFALAQALLEEDREMMRKRVVEKQTCNICYEDKEQHEMWYEGCAHEEQYCLDCTATYISHKIREKDTDLRCPDESCKMTISRDGIMFMLNNFYPDLVPKYDEFLYHNALAKMPDISYCPQKGCGTPCPRNGDQLMVTCLNTDCKHEFCFTCHSEWHPDVTCEQYKDWKKRHSGEDVRYLIWMEKHKTKPCPRCGFICEKDNGCNHVNCANCKAEFCWRCLAQIKGYDHFSTCRQYGD